MKLTAKQRATLEAAAASTGRAVTTKGRTSAHHQRLVDRGLMVRKGSTMIPEREWRRARWDLPPQWTTRRYRHTVWMITHAGLDAIAKTTTETLPGGWSG